MTFGDGRPSIKTFTGRYVYPLDPDPNDIDIVDIAHALSHQCRFSGHVREFYSVAQHSVHVSNMLTSALPGPRTPGSVTDALWGLLHDASEAYLVDLPRPLKQDPALGERYRFYENQLMAVIAKAFGLPLQEPERVKYWDTVLLVTEARDLMGNTKSWYPDITPLMTPIICWTPPFARAEFLAKFGELTRLRIAGLEVVA